MGHAVTALTWIAAVREAHSGANWAQGALRDQKLSPSYQLTP